MFVNRLHKLTFSFSSNKSLYFRLQKYATRKRFYRGTDILQNDNKWEITLDHRRLKTPGGKILSLDNEALARAVAAEWDAQAHIIAQPIMHLTALCNTALDNPGKQSKHDICAQLLDYLETDTLLFHSEENEELQALQEERWSPIINWLNKRFGVELRVSCGLQLPPITTDTRATLAKHFLSYEFPALSAFRFGAEAMKSPVLMLACAEKLLTASEAVLLSRLEEEYQLLYWGRVPWAHEQSQVDLTSRVAAAILVMYSTGSSQSISTKNSNSEYHTA